MILLTNGGQWGTLETTSGTAPLQARHALYGYNQNDSNNYTVLQGNDPAWTTGNIAFTASPFYGADTCAYPSGSSTSGEVCIDIYNTATKVFSMPSWVYGFLQADSCDVGGPLAEVDWARWAPDGSDLIFQYKLCAGGTGPGRRT
jgi:hypothetical protein